MLLLRGAFVYIRVSPAMVCRALRGLQGYQAVMDSPGQRAILDSLGHLASLGDQALMECQAPKVRNFSIVLSNTEHHFYH